MRVFSVLRMIFRRILAHWRLELGLLAGLLLAAGVVTAVPLYTTGALQDSFLKAWVENADGQVPGTYTISILTSQWGWRETDLTSKEFLAAFAHARKTVPTRLGLPLLSSGWTSCMADQLELPGPDNNPDAPEYATIQVMTGLERLIDLSEGRQPADSVGPDGVVEAVCSQTTADKLGLMIGRSYTMRSTLFTHGAKGNTEAPEPTTEVVFHLVGTFTLRRDRLADPGWINNMDVGSSLFVHPRVFLSYLVRQKEAKLDNLDLTWVIDYRRVHIKDLPRLIRTFNAIERECRLFNEHITLAVSPVDIFTRFLARQKSLRLMMLALALPMLVLVLYYVVLMAGLIVGQRRGEIAVLRSRGASTVQLVSSFVLEWALLGACCLVLGPPLGFFFAQVVGASAGFLSFVDRRALPVALTLDAYLYAAALAGIMVVAASVPAARACRHTIVSAKQEQSRGTQKPFWQRFFLDLLLLALGVLGHRFMVRQALAVTASFDAWERLVDPLLFVVPILLVAAAGLLLLRLLPALAGVAARLLARRRALGLYSSFLEISRCPGRYRPLILLIVMTTATGIYGAAIARTLDENTRDRVYYAVGTDVVLRERWFRMKPAATARPPVGGPPIMLEDTSRPFEPSFLTHREAPGVVAAARVQTTVSIPLYAGREHMADVTVMAVEPVEFARTAWFRRGLLARHPFAYLNMLTRYPQGVLVSRGLVTGGSLKLGDTVTLEINRQAVDFVIVGALDYWPSLYAEEEPFAVVNLDYLTRQSSLAPYHIWLKLAPGAKLDPVLRFLERKAVSVVEAKDARRGLIVSRRDPQRMGLYGVISIGFCVAVLITVAGVVLYTFISIRSRFMLFGVLRATGLSLGQMIGQLALEQLWSVGLGLLVGTIAGRTVSRIFVPFVRTAAMLRGETPPFHVVIANADITTIYGVLLPILVAALAGLAVLLARLQIHQAIKLGEEG